MLKGKKVLLGVTASIAAYKTAYLVRLLKKEGANIQVVQTEESLEFITPLTLSTLSGNPVLTKMLDKKVWNNHVELALWADIMLIAPVTAKTMSKMALGDCDTLLLATYLSAKCPVYFAPAMDLDMYKHKSTKNNINKLIGFGNKLIPSPFGELASGLCGEGRMAEPEDIIKFIQDDIYSSSPFINKKILITAGPTYESIDPVRFIGNHSSGLMGISLAEVAASLGAEVDLILGPTSLSCSNDNIHVYRVNTADEMLLKTQELFSNCNIAIFSAAVSDYKASHVSKQKKKRTNKDFTISLVPTKDIIKETTMHKSTNQFIVGFALETENELENAKLKLKEKNLDMIVLNSLNDAGAGFKGLKNKVSIIDKNNNIYKFELKDKYDVALDILNQIISHNN